MPDIKITNLPLGTEIADDDELLYIDTSDTTAGPYGTDKRVLIGSLRNIANRNMTTVELINSSLNVVEGESITTNGFYEDGDGGGAQWVLTSETGTASQDVIDTQSDTITDADGRVYELASGDTLNLRFFGAMGDYDPNTGTGEDAYPRVQACFNSVTKRLLRKWNGTTVYAPEGIYLMSKRAECMVVTKSSTDATFTGPVGLHMYGDGEGQTLFYASNDNDEGLMRLYSDRNNECYEFNNIGLISDLSEFAETHNGVALTIDSTLGKGDAGWGGHGKYSVYIHDVYIGGWNSGGGSNNINQHNFAKGIYVGNKWFPMIERVRINGKNELPVIPETARTHGIHMFSCYTPYIDKVYVQGGWNIGIHIEGNKDVALDLEDMRLTNIFCVRQNTGLFIDRDVTPVPALGDPGGTIDTIHVNANNYGLHIKGHRQLTITNLYGYCPSNERVVDVLLPACVLLENATDIVMNSIEFLEPGFYNSDENASCGLKVIGDTAAVYCNAQWGNGGIGAHINSDAPQKSIHLTGMDEARTTVAWANRVPLIDLSGSSIKYGVQANTGSSRDTMFIEGRKTPTGTGANMYFEFRGNRSGFETAFSGASSVIRNTERNTLGEDFMVSQVISSVKDSTEGSENTSVLVQGTCSGVSRNLLELSEGDNNLDSSAILMVNVGSGRVYRRVRVGTQGSAPDGSGRLLYIDA